MSRDSAIEQHYGRPGLLERMLHTLAKKGITESDINFETLAAVDEFHVGGLDATRRINGRLGLIPQDRLIDLGCGSGGPARAMAAISGCHVVGIDLTAEFISAGKALNQMTGQADRVELMQGSSLDMPLADNSFSQAVMLHVGMNVADKAGIMREAFRILQPGGRFCIYDIMQISEGPLTFPFPWASSASLSAVASPEDYLAAATSASFSLDAQHDQSAGMAKMLTEIADKGTANRPDDASDPVRNLARQIDSGLLGPTEIYLRKSDKG